MDDTLTDMEEVQIGRPGRLFFTERSGGENNLPSYSRQPSFKLNIEEISFQLPNLVSVYFKTKRFIPENINKQNTLQNFQLLQSYLITPPGSNALQVGGIEYASYIPLRDSIQWGRFLEEYLQTLVQTGPMFTDILIPTDVRVIQTYISYSRTQQKLVCHLINQSNLK